MSILGRNDRIRPRLLLRRETFGGILFMPEDAVHIELDRDGFAFMLDHLMSGRAPKNAEETRLLDSVLVEIGTDRPEQTRVVEYARDVEAYPFPVYNAPTLADFQITTMCPMGCPHCYASSEPDGKWVELKDIEHVFDELKKNGITQVAIGGGEPLGHPDLIQVLELCHSRGMVPNLTTNGIYFSPDRLAAMKKYCGAVALSLEGVGEKFSRTRKAGLGFFKERLEELMGCGIATVLQVTLSRENFDDLDDIVDFCLEYPHLYGVIFLAYKEVGRGGRFDHVLAGLPSKRIHEQLRNSFVRLSKQTRVGYDCCLTPGIVGVESDLSFTQKDQLEGCSAMRSSMGILPSLDVVPCTFTGDIVMGNLGHETLFDIWRRHEAESFRRRIKHRFENDRTCAECHSRLTCLGGCPVFDLVHCQYLG
ncbi:MAG: radical SAM protein [Proteobacteria bacterium]|nr:radical SAM protein [Pseudomonadota bacterium]